MVPFERGSPDTSLSSADLKEGLITALDRLGVINRMLIIPPDITRMHSRAGELTRYAYEHLPETVEAIIPALGTHLPMTEKELSTMFGNVPQKLFVPHRWRTDCLPLGEVPLDFVTDVSQGIVKYPIAVSVNRLLLERRYDCILSISQVVPHEVAGMAGFSKNIVVGLGGRENIHKSHFLGAAYGMERIMGRADSPVRKVLDYAAACFLSSLPIVHAITVIGHAADGTQAVRGLFIGNDRDCFRRAAELSQRVNITILEKHLRKVVVYLDPVEYRSTWLGNKSIYRTRMAIADKGELVVLAPGVKMFGEDGEIDRLIRKFGYKGTSEVMRRVETDGSLKNNLSAAAHLIHGSSEGRFTITYCTGGLDSEEVENAGFRYAPVEEMMKRYDPGRLPVGYSTMPDGEEIFYIANPGSGLWAYSGNFYSK
jgi:nickel-dependent lactate racemase